MANAAAIDPEAPMSRAVIVSRVASEALSGTWPRVFGSIRRMTFSPRLRSTLVHEDCDVLICYESDQVASMLLATAGIVARDALLVAVWSARSALLVATALDAGFDDVLSPDIAPVEFLARLRAIRRRRGANADPRSQWPARANEGRVSLRRAEANILDYLAKHADRVVSQREIVERVLGGTHTSDGSLVRVHVASLRKKLGVARDVVRTIRGRGYILDRDRLGDFRRETRDRWI